MAKGRPSTVFFCNECGYESSKWMGQCPACKAWNTFVEEPVVKTAQSARTGTRKNAPEPMSVSAVSPESMKRCKTGMSELDRVLGGGIVPGSLVLVGGDPGIGKSTLLLQLCRNLSSQHHKRGWLLLQIIHPERTSGGHDDSDDSHAKDNIHQPKHDVSQQ